MKKRLLLLLPFFLLLAGCGMADPEIASDFTVIEESAFRTEEPQPDVTSDMEPTVTTTEPLTTAAKTTEATTTTTSVSENTEKRADDISYGVYEGKKSSEIALQHPLSEEDLDTLRDVDKLTVVLSEFMDLSMLLRLESLESVRIEYETTGEPCEIEGLDELLRADLSELTICGGGNVLNLNGIQNDHLSHFFIIEATLKTDQLTSFENMNLFEAFRVTFEEESPFSPFQSAKKVHIQYCDYKSVNSISAFSEVESLSIIACDISELNALQDLPQLFEVALYTERRAHMCGVDALKNLHSIERIHYGFSFFSEEEEALLKEWYPDCYFHVIYGI